MRRSAAFLALGLAALVTAQYPSAAKPPANLRKGYDAIKEADARTILGYLAGPETQGRGTGQPGFQKAAEYIAAQFKAAGLKPMGENGTYFQHGTFYRPAISGVSFTTADGKAFTDSQLALTPFGRDVDVTAKIVVVRGAAEDRLTEEQAKSLDGAIVVAMITSGTGRRNPLRSQINLSDAKAVLTVSDRVSTQVPRVSQRSTPPSATARVNGQIARDALGLLGSQTGAFLAQAQSGASLLVLPDGAHLVAKGSIEEVKVPNVVALLEGSDPKLKNEYIGIGGHLDHLGVVNGVVYPGADDDASGCTAVALVAKGFAASSVKPKRSILFMTFFGEEMGLLGSKHLVDNSPVPIDKMVAEFQMDMVGRDSDGVQNGDESRVDKREENVDTIRLVGSKRISTELDTTIQEMNKYVGFRFKYDAEDVYTRSDHYNFAAKGIPIAFLFDGFHPDYHQPTDTVDKINFNKVVSAAKLYYLSAMTVANRPLPPKKDVPQEK
ncbi:M28 family peptidase [bacterium]|nr:MAG: M28 family peptidase [bacterium]